MLTLILDNEVALVSQIEFHEELIHLAQAGNLELYGASFPIQETFLTLFSSALCSSTSTGETHELGQLPFSIVSSSTSSSGLLLTTIYQAGGKEPA